MVTKATLTAFLSVFGLQPERGNPRRFVKPSQKKTTLLIGPTTGRLIFRTPRYALTLGDRKDQPDYMLATMSGNPTRSDYLLLAELDDKLNGRLAKALMSKPHYQDYANQIERHGLAIRAGQGPIYAAR